MMTEPSYDLNRLALLGGATPRTVRFYIQQGLLASPDGGDGPVDRYSQQHLDRLRLIGELQREQLPVSEIRAHLEGLTAEEVRQLLETGASARAASSVIEHLQSMLAGSPRSSAPA